MTSGGWPLPAAKSFVTECPEFCSSPPRSFLQRSRNCLSLSENECSHMRSQATSLPQCPEEASRPEPDERSPSREALDLRPSEGSRLPPSLHSDEAHSR